MRCTTAIAAFLALTAILPAQVAGAQDGAKPGKYSQLLTEVDALLQDGDPQKAYKKINAIQRELTNRIVGGTNVGQILGITTVLRAVAAYQLGRQDEAVWHWKVAIQMFPEAADFELTPFGDGGDFLKSRSAKERLPKPDYDMRSLKPPKKVQSSGIRIPDAKRGTGKVTVIVQAIIGKDGRLREPVILESAGEMTLVYATLESIRGWKFKPAELDGEPVEVNYNVSSSFNP